MDDSYNYESKEDRAVSDLEDQLKLKQDDWIEACKEIDELEAKLAEAGKEVEVWKGFKSQPVGRIYENHLKLEEKLKLAVEALEDHKLRLEALGLYDTGAYLKIIAALTKIEGV